MPGERKLTWSARLIADGEGAPVTYVFWMVDGSDYVGNGVVNGDLVFITEAFRKSDIRLELDSGRQLKIWLDNLELGVGEVSFYREASEVP